MHHHHDVPAGTKTETCPVCLMEVDPETSEHAEYEGKTYWFCAEVCLEQFERNPSSYV